MDPKALASWGAIVVSVLSLGAFFLAFGVAYLSSDQNNLSLLDGSAIGMASTAVAYWLGSSSGSQKKDDVIAAKIEPKPDTKVPNG